MSVAGEMADRYPSLAALFGEAIEGVDDEILGRCIEAYRILDAAVARYHPSKMFAMYSGGDDSSTVTRLFSVHPRFSGVLHIDTLTGVPETLEFVKNTCKLFGWPLQIYRPPRGTYERLIFQGHETQDGRIFRGFPHGTLSHANMYSYLKGNQLDRAVREHRTNPKDKIGLVNGARTSESKRRKRSTFMRTHMNTEGSKLWISPIREWTKPQCLDFIAATGTPRNPVSINCHRSGECLCGALANFAELGEIAFFYPHVGKRYEDMMQLAKERGLTNWQWAGGPSGYRRLLTGSERVPDAMLKRDGAGGKVPQTSPLCTSCEENLAAGVIALEGETLEESSDAESEQYVEV